VATGIAHVAQQKLNCRIVSLAHQMTRSTQSHFDSFDLTEQDYGDMCQEAAVADRYYLMKT
jgi:hypothetical protein